MGMPAVLAQTGTGTLYWNPDWFQDPFSIGIQLVVGTAIATSATVDWTADDINGSLGTAGAHWTNILTTTGSSLFTTANFTTPCQWMRVNVPQAVSTTVVTGTFVQAQFPR